MVNLKTKLERSDMSIKEIDAPLATLVIREYKLINQNLRETLNGIIKIKNWLLILVIILITLLAIETTYIIICWDFMNPNIGVIKNNE